MCADSLPMKAFVAIGVGVLELELEYSSFPQTI